MDMKDREHASSTKDREHARRIQTQQSSADIIVKEEVAVHHIRMIDADTQSVEAALDFAC